MYHTRLQVSSLLVVYNAFMNAVDRSDQRNSWHTTMWREKRVFKSLLTFAFETILQNAFSVAQKIEPSDVRFVDFKQKVAVQLVTPKLQRLQNNF